MHGFSTLELPPVGSLLMSRFLIAHGPLSLMVYACSFPYSLERENGFRKFIPEEIIKILQVRWGIKEEHKGKEM